MAKSPTQAMRSVLEARDGAVTARFLIVMNNNHVHIPVALRERVYAAEERFRKNTTPHWGEHINQAARQSFARLAKRTQAVAKAPAPDTTRSVLAARDAALVSTFMRVLRRHGVKGTKAILPLVTTDLDAMRARTTPTWGTHIKRADRQKHSALFAEQTARKAAKTTRQQP